MYGKPLETLGEVHTALSSGAKPYRCIVIHVMESRHSNPLDLRGIIRPEKELYTLYRALVHSNYYKKKSEIYYYKHRLLNTFHCASSILR